MTALRALFLKMPFFNDVIKRKKVVYATSVAKIL